jgi:predicted PurR-regulated permease PerM
MENTELVLAVIGIQTTILLFILGYVIHKMDKLDEKINNVDKKLSDKIDGVDKKLSDKIDGMQMQINTIHTDLQIIKSILHMKECCMINDESKMKKVE